MNHSEKVKMIDGMIIRDSAMLINDKRAVSIQK
jgi:hypothetical protein